MTRTFCLALAVALLGYAALCLAMFVFQRSLLYHPQPRGITAPESTMRLPVDGAEIVVTVHPRGSPKAVVYFGGNAEDVSWNLPTYVQAFPDHAIYLMHYRGYGGSQGRPSERDNVADGMALMQKLRAVHSEVTLIGRSLGSGVAVQVASRLGASRLVLITPYDNLVDIAALAYPFIPVRWLMLDDHDSGSLAGALRIPTTLIAAEHDDVIPRSSTHKLLSRFAPGVAKLTVIPGADHDNLSAHSTYLATLQAAVR